MSIVNSALVGLELRRIARTPSMLVPALLLPSVLLLIAAETSAASSAGTNSVSTGVARFLTFCAQSSAAFALATSVASDRETRFYTILRALPVSMTEYCTAKFVSAWTLCTLSLLAILTTFYLAFGFVLPWPEVIVVVLLQLVATVPTMLMGAVIGALAAPSAAAGFAGLFVIPMGYFARLLGIAALTWPDVGVASLLPPFHGAYLTAQVARGEVALLAPALVGLATTVAAWSLVLGALLWLIVRKGANDGT